jgi:hypothetical protein
MITCAYYRKKFPMGLWALRVCDGQIIEAVGPLPESAASDPPPSHHSKERVDITGLTLEDFTIAGDLWECGERREIGAEATCEQSENGFEIGVKNV